MKKHQSKSLLGVMVTAQALHAVLTEDGVDGPVVIRRFTRRRSVATSGTPDVSTDSPSLANDGGGDFTIQFGEASGANPDSLFLGSEFAGLDDAPAGASAGGAGALPPVQTFEFELFDILAECKDAGHEDPNVAFALGTADTVAIELEVPPRKQREEKNGKEAKEGKDAGRSQLLSLLEKEHGEKVADERVVFIPMTPTEEGNQRVLAVFARPDEPVLPTVEVLRREKDRRMPFVELLDAEVPLYLGLGRMAGHVLPSAMGGHETEALPQPAPGEARRTLIVRAGHSDTLVFFLADDTLQHFENLRSITTYDAPETICSRVLLLQDEYAIGDVQRVLVLSDEREDVLVGSFRTFFQDARVESLRRYMPELADSAERRAPMTDVLAAGASLRLIKDVVYQECFEDVNLLPKQLLGRKFQLPFTWHVPVMALVLFATVLFFMGRYFSQESAIGEREASLARYEAQARVARSDAHVLQARIDSLKQASNEYVHALNVLDSLLVGSDRWSRTLERSAEHIADVRGIWIEKWNPEGSRLRLVGQATRREHIVDLARRLDGQIETLSFSEIRDWPVYRFQMRIPLERKLPEVAQFLRQRAMDEIAEMEAERRTGSAAGSTQADGGSAPVQNAVYVD